MKIFFGVLAGIIFLLTLTAGGWAWKYYTAEIRGRVDAEQRIESGANRIQQYNKFFNMCNNVKSIKTALDSQRSLLDNAEDSKERSRIRSNIAGMEAQLARYVNQYNSEASQSYTAARFLASELPYQLNIDGETQC